MNGHLIALCVALIAISVLLPPVAASRDSRWSGWSIPEKLGPGINTAFSEAGPVISRDGLTLYFNSTRPGVLPAPGVPPEDVAFGDADLYVARRESVHDPWAAAVNLGGKVNTAGFEGFPALSRNEHHLFFARSGGEIWVSYRVNADDDLGDSGWEAPQLLGPGVNTAAPEQGPAYFENRKRGLPQLFFHSIRPGGVGAVDIYVADAFVLGPAVPVPGLNSEAVDARPSLTADGLEIFFHSNRTGSAGFDMYSSRRKNVLAPWSEPESLGNVVNTAASDFLGAISPDGDTLVFTSNRDGSNDIFVTTREKHGRHHRD